MKKTLYATLLALGLAPLAAQAAVYKYVDENGVMRYTDVPPVSQPVSEVQIRDAGPRAPDARPSGGTLDIEAGRVRVLEEKEKEERIRQQEAAAQKYTSCALANQLRAVGMGNQLSKRLIDSASGTRHSTWRQVGGRTETRVLSYEPVCGNSTRYTITINNANYVWDISREIARQ